MNDAIIIGRKLTRLREHNNLTQDHMARQLGVDQSTYSRYEKGELHVEQEKLRKAAEVLKVPESIFEDPHPLEFNIHQSHGANGFNVILHEQHNIIPKEVVDKMLVQLDERSKTLEMLCGKTLDLQQRAFDMIERFLQEKR